ncbi:MaoC/PaaZ C-terminal domain-containing protein [Ferrimonas lipolytica]|uniref:MaoC-like domain-containing protein n=1 Tax=Ferrimonas lipolytica TaxID=2724191 RepID=A0A6H1UC37_9GAMM|nr:MaoC/PaaZ C-terminal domain-containing protein [Ferrimonas lipolytica]QIZ76408.1 hypothetical protein HER31_05760 [Ferrimonas lipolytica]
MKVSLKQSQIPSHISLLWKVFTKKTQPAKLPLLRVQVDDFCFDEAAIEKYNRYCGFESGSFPLCYAFVATQPVQLIFLTDNRIPVTPLGMIHMGVSFEQITPFNCAESYRFELSVGEQQRGERGLEFELVGEFSLNGEAVARYRSRCFIKMEGTKGSGRPARVKPVKRTWAPLTPLQLDSTQARGYARLSGDYNPIHLHRLLSKPFGFDEPIAHGMYMVAKVLAASPTDLTKASFEFKRPALLPISGAVEGCDGAMRFVNDKNKPVVECQFG